MAAEWAGAAAHVKWFEDPSRYLLRTDLIVSDRTIVLVGVAVVALGLLYLLRRLVGDPHWPELGFLQKMAIGAPTLLAVQAAVSLVHAAVQPILFVPNMPLPLNGAGLAVAALEVLIAFSLITGIGDWVVILFMWVPFNVSVPFLPPQELIGHLPIFGIMYFLLVHSAGIAPGESIDRPARPGAPAARSKSP